MQLESTPEVSRFLNSTLEYLKAVEIQSLVSLKHNDDGCDKGKEQWRVGWRFL